MKPISLWSFLLLLAAFGCKKEAAENALPQREPGDYYVSFVVKGQKREFVGRDAFGYRVRNYQGSSVSGNTIHNMSYCQLEAITSPNTKEKFLFEISNLLQPGYSFHTDYLSPGMSIPFLSPLSFTGMSFVYYKSLNDPWSSKQNYAVSLGATYQTGSQVILNGFTRVLIDRKVYLQADITFSCKLYSMEGDSMMLNNARAYILLHDELPGGGI